MVDILSSQHSVWGGPRAIDLVNLNLVDISAPIKNSPTRRRHPPGPSRPSPPPLLGFSVKNQSPPPPRGASDSPFPLPEQKKIKISETSTKERFLGRSRCSQVLTWKTNGKGPPPPPCGGALCCTLTSLNLFFVFFLDRAHPYRLHLLHTLQKLAGEFFCFFTGNFGRNFAGILRDFSVSDPQYTLSF